MPLHIQGFASVAISGPIATALAKIDYGTTVAHRFVACQTTIASNCNGVTRASGLLDDTYLVSSNTVLFIWMQARGYANSIIGAASHSAYADPLITIDPAFLLGHPGYKLDFSPNLSVSPVPEQTIYGMFLAGIELMGVRRQKIRQA